MATAKIRQGTREFSPFFFFFLGWKLGLEECLVGIFVISASMYKRKGLYHQLTFPALLPRLSYDGRNCQSANEFSAPPHDMTRAECEKGAARYKSSNDIWRERERESGGI